MLGHRQAHGQPDDQIQDGQQQERQPPTRQRRVLQPGIVAAFYHQSCQLRHQHSRSVRVHLSQLIPSLLGLITQQGPKNP